jgi:hypothetical protein
MRISGLLSVVLLAACSGEAAAPEVKRTGKKVVTSGKVEVGVSEVPPPVLAAAQAAQPGFQPAEAEAETRDGRRYFDLGGKTADGAEIEFDIMEEGGQWRVVEVQRDIAFAAVPPQVRSAAAQHDPDLVPNRVIESRQADSNLTLYELYGAAVNDAAPVKVEVKWDGRTADVLDEEWAH